MDDVMAVVNKQFPGSEKYGVGFSLGGCYLLKLVAMQGKNCEFQAVCTISQAFDVMTTVTKLHYTMSGLYDWVIAT